jgi:hypothetical protein
LRAGGGPVPARVILLRAAGDQEVDVEAVECDDPAVRCTRAKGPGNMCTLRLQIDRSRLAADGLNTLLRVRLARPAGETVTIPVHCTTR